MTKKASEIRYEMKQIEESFHIKAYAHSRRLSLSFYVFRKNYLLFKKHLEINNDTDYFSQIDYSANSEEFEYRKLNWDYRPFEKETYYFFLNFINSAIALINHTRDIVREVYSGTDFQKEYQNKVDHGLTHAPINRFIQELKLFIQNSRFPLVSTQIRYGRVAPLGDKNDALALRIQLMLDKKQLLRWQKWTQTSRQYLWSQGEEISVDTLIDEYYLLIEEFTSWFGKSQQKMHESEYLGLLVQWEELCHRLSNSAG